MKQFFIMIFLIFFTFPVSGKVIHVFPDLINPDRMVTGDEYLYVNEGFSVIIYSLKDYSFVKKVGKEGEGPGEFVGHLHLALYDNHLYVNSIGKLSIFEKTGFLFKEIKSKDSTAGRFSPLDGKFLKQLFIPLKMKSIYLAFPWFIKGDKFYQLIENEDEECELHVNIINLK